jgi:hypothetical protein
MPGAAARSCLALRHVGDIEGEGVGSGNERLLGLFRAFSGDTSQHLGRPAPRSAQRACQYGEGDWLEARHAAAVCGWR